MKIPREVQAAAALGIVLGIVGSALVGTSPRRIGEPDHLPGPPPIDIAGEAAPPAGPDHYPLITPRGRVEVGELAMHGLYRNLRHRPLYEAEWADPEFAMETGWEESELSPEPDPLLPEADDPIAIDPVAPRRIAARVETGQEIARIAIAEAEERPAARVIHVASELAENRSPARQSH